MRCREYVFLVVFLVLLSSVGGAGAKTTVKQSGGLDNFVAWFTGEFSNYEQYKQWAYDLKQGKADKRFKFLHVHHRFEPIEMEGADHAFYVQQRMVKTGTLFRERVYVIDQDDLDAPIRLKIYKFKGQPKTHDLNVSDLEYLDGCDVEWTYDEQQAAFKGQTGQDTCKVASRRTKGQLTINDTLTLDATGIQIKDIARRADGEYVFGHPEKPAYTNRKVTYFTGWAAMKTGGQISKPDTKTWRLHKAFRIHNEGGSAGLIDAAGADMGYRVELARLTRSRFGTKLLKLSVIDTKTDKTVAYTWSDPDSELIGINAGWIRIGVKLAKRSAGFALPQKKEPALVSVVADYLEGRFSSAEQANEDPNFRAISLKTCRIPLPALGKDVLYVEQALASKATQPYRQRLYQLTQLPDGRVESAIYTLKDPKEWVGTCDSKPDFTQKTPGFTKKPGCEVKLRFDGKKFAGKTNGKSCETKLRGARYATAEVELEQAGMTALDRGFDGDDKQVWGSTSGPYRFKRINSIEQN